MRQTRVSSEGSLFTLELSAHGGTVFSRGKEAASSNRIGQAGSDALNLAAYSAPKTMFEFKLLEAVRKLKPACVVASDLDYDSLSKLLAALGFNLHIRTPATQCGCRPSSRRCLESLSHTYLTCTGTEEPGIEEEVIVEPRLREQFEIAYKTEQYKQMLEEVPAEFVGSRAKLKLIVETMSAAIAEAFKAQDLPLPPWRRTSAALSKWDLESAVAGRSPGHSPEAGPAWQPEARTPPSRRQAREGGLPRFGFPENILPRAASPRGLVATRDAGQKAGHERGLGKSPAGHRSKPTISLLARGLADMAIVQKAKRPPDSAKVPGKLKRAASWDFSGLPPITTVRRSGRLK